MPCMVNPYRFGGGFPANAVTFDGTNDYLTKAGNLTGVVDGKQFTLSFWFKQNANNDPTIFALGNRFVITINSVTGLLFLNVQNSSGTVILQSSISPVVNDGNWHHAIISVDLTSTARRHVYIDNVAYAAAWPVYTNNNINFEAGSAGVGAAPTGLSKYSGDLSELYFDTTYRDLSSVNLLRNFISADGRPARRANGGAIWMTGETSGWGDNKGSGGNFALFGALTTSTNLPVEL